jgi:hypothetical protein
MYSIHLHEKWKGSYAKALLDVFENTDEYDIIFHDLIDIS